MANQKKKEVNFVVLKGSIKSVRLNLRRLNHGKKDIALVISFLGKC